MARRRRRRRTQKDLTKTVHKETLWALTFTKKLVSVIVLFFTVATTYVGFVMYKFQDFTYLGTVYEAICDLVEVVAFGYLMKAGAENIPKILNGTKHNEDNSDTEG